MLQAGARLERVSPYLGDLVAAQLDAREFPQRVEGPRRQHGDQVAVEQQCVAVGEPAGVPREHRVDGAQRVAAEVEEGDGAGTRLVVPGGDDVEAHGAAPGHGQRGGAQASDDGVQAQLEGDDAHPVATVDPQVVAVGLRLVRPKRRQRLRVVRRLDAVDVGGTGWGRASRRRGRRAQTAHGGGAAGHGRTDDDDDERDDWWRHGPVHLYRSGGSVRAQYF